jgi:hypothetical protein
MKPFKMAAMTIIVAGAGLALASAQAFAVTDCGASTACTSHTSAEISAGNSEGTSDTTILHQSTTGTGTTAASTNDGSTISLGGSTSTSDAVAGSLLGGGLTNSSASSQFGLIHSSTWEKSGGTTESSSGGSGESLAAVFVFGQNIVVDGSGELVDESGAAKTVGVATSFASVAGQLALNQTDGVGNQQANLFATLAELNGSSTGPNSGSNAINVTDGQNIIVTDNAEVSNEPYVHATTYPVCEAGTDDCRSSQTPPPGDTVGIATSFASVAGSVAINQSAGVANQQANSVLIAH